MSDKGLSVGFGCQEQANTGAFLTQGRHYLNVWPFTFSPLQDFLSAAVLFFRKR